MIKQVYQFWICNESIPSHWVECIKSVNKFANIQGIVHKLVVSSEFKEQDKFKGSNIIIENCKYDYSNDTRLSLQNLTHKAKIVDYVRYWYLALPENRFSLIIDVDLFLFRNYFKQFQGFPLYQIEGFYALNRLQSYTNASLYCTDHLFFKQLLEWCDELLESNENRIRIFSKLPQFFKSGDLNYPFIDLGPMIYNKFIYNTLDNRTINTIHKDVLFKLGYPTYETLYHAISTNDEIKLNHHLKRLFNDPKTCGTHIYKPMKLRYNDQGLTMKWIDLLKSLYY